MVDTGIGIVPADQERVFQEYVQIDGPSQRRRPGTGLGLPLTRKLASLLGGRIELASELGRGSTFNVVIPSWYPAWSGSDAEERSLSLADAESSNRAWADLSGTRIL